MAVTAFGTLLILGACGDATRLGTVPTPTPSLLSTVGATATEPAGSLAAPTVSSEKAPTPPLSPVFSFMPRSGGPGTALNISGVNFRPGSMVVFRVGFPDPVGEALGSVKTGEDGRWNTRVVVPGTLPSGQAITETELSIVAMDDTNKLIASRPFRFVPATPAP